MDVGSILVSPVSAGTGEVERAARIAPVAETSGRVRTELPASATVEPAGRSRPADGEAPTRSTSVERRSFLDPATQVVVSRITDQRTGIVVRQVPDEALLRLKAYARALRRADDIRPANVRGAVQI